MARYRIGSSKYRETVRTALVGGVVFLSAIVYSVVSGLEERKRRYELQQKSFEKLDKLIKAKFNLPDDQGELYIYQFLGIRRFKRNNCYSLIDRSYI